MDTAASPGDAAERLVADPAFAGDVVRFDLPRLVTSRAFAGCICVPYRALTRSRWARLGAKMTGLDFSPVLLAEARRIAARSGADVKFAGSDLVG